jgi:excisionase family DNA binding protein
MSEKRTATILSPRQVAQMWGTSLTWVYVELWAGRIPGAQKVGRKWRIPRSAMREPTQGAGGRQCLNDCSQVTC